MTNQPLDSNELRFNLSELSNIDISSLTKTEKRIQRLTWASIIVIFLSSIHEFITYEGNDITEKNLPLIVLVISMIYLSLPLVYIQFWKKVIHYNTENNIDEFLKNSKILRIGVVILFLGAFLWLVGSMVIFLFAFFSESVLSMIDLWLIAVLLITNHSLQLSYYIKTSDIVQRWQKELDL